MKTTICELRLLIHQILLEWAVDVLPSAKEDPYSARFLQWLVAFYTSEGVTQ